MARWLHEAFQRRTEARGRAWEDVPERHRLLLTAVAADVLARLSRHLLTLPYEER